MTLKQHLLNLYREYGGSSDITEPTPEVELLVSTMNKDDEEFLEGMISEMDKTQLYITVVNQRSGERRAETGEKKEKEKQKGKECFSHAIRIFDVDDSGLSKSRNTALKIATGDICLFADDDLVYYEGFAECVNLAHHFFPEYHVILFRVNDGTKQPARRYADKISERNIENAAAVISYEISFKRDAVVETGVRFDEMFGLNATFHISEERIFIADCINAGLKVLEIPIAIVEHKGISTGLNPDNRYINQVCHGAAYARIYGRQEALRRFSVSMSRIDPDAPVSRMDDYLYFFKGITDYCRMTEGNSQN